MTDTPVHPAEDTVLLYPEAARLLRISERTLRRFVADGTVPHLRIGGSVRFSRKALLDLVQSGSLAADSETA